MCGFLIKSAYVKINSHLLQFLCHMTSDVKFSQVLFFLICIVVQSLYEVKELWLLNKYRSFQKQSFTDFHRRPATLLKRDSNTAFFREFCEIFKNTFFTEPLRWLLLISLEHKSKNDKIYLHKYIHRKTPVMASFLAQLQTWEHIVLRQRHSSLDAFTKFVKFYRISFVK